MRPSQNVAAGFWDGKVNKSQNYIDGVSSWSLVHTFRGSGDSRLPPVNVHESGEPLALRWAVKADETFPTCSFEIEVNGAACDVGGVVGSGGEGDTYLTTDRGGQLVIKVDAMFVDSWEIELWSQYPVGRQATVDALPTRNSSLLNRSDETPDTVPSDALVGSNDLDAAELVWLQGDDYQCRGHRFAFSDWLEGVWTSTHQMFLEAHGLGFLSRNSFVPPASQEWLDKVVAIAHDSQHMWHFEPLSPSSVFTELVTVVNWLEYPRLISWVGYPRCGSLVEVSLETWDVHGIPGPATTVAAGLGISWLLDRVLRSETAHPLVRSDGERTLLDLSRRWSVPPEPHERRAHIRTLSDGRRGSPEAHARAPEYIRRTLRSDQTYVRASNIGEAHDAAVRAFTKSDSFLRYHLSLIGISTS